MKIAQSSPLYEYWNSKQDENDEKNRLLKINKKAEASPLFMNEPYKWENLYQSVLRNVINGDESSIKGLMVLLSTINENEKDKVLNTLENLLNKEVIQKLRNEKFRDMKSSKNFCNNFKILLNIFINPYELELKKEKKYIYEKTGMFFYKLRRVLFQISNNFSST